MRHLSFILKDPLYIGGLRADGHAAYGTLLAPHTRDILDLKKEEEKADVVLAVIDKLGLTEYENINYPRVIRASGDWSHCRWYGTCLHDSAL